VCCCGGPPLDTDVANEHNADGNEPPDTNATAKVDGASTGESAVDGASNGGSTVDGLPDADNTMAADQKQDSGEKTHAPNRSSVQWASPDGSMEEFNSPSKRDVANDTNTTTAQAQTLEDPIDEERPEGMDEETFRRYQQYFQERDREAAEQKAQALVGCCSICFEMIVLCLLVAKLEYDYNAYVLDGDQNDTGGFNAIWVLFPILFLSGCVLLLCTTCICVQRTKTTESSQPPNTEATSSATSPVVLPDPSALPPITASLDSVVAATSTTATSVDHPLTLPFEASTVPTISGKVENDIEVGGALDELD
jgi:hypothetical protein